MILEVQKYAVLTEGADQQGGQQIEIQTYVVSTL